MELAELRALFGKMNAAEKVVAGRIEQWSRYKEVVKTKLNGSFRGVVPEAEAVIVEDQVRLHMPNSQNLVGDKVQFGAILTFAPNADGLIGVSWSPPVVVEATKTVPAPARTNEYLDGRALEPVKWEVDETLLDLLKSFLGKCVERHWAKLPHEPTGPGDFGPR